MSFLDFRPEPADEATQRRPVSILDEFPSESSVSTATSEPRSDQPDAIDSITRRLRSQEADQHIANAADPTFWTMAARRIRSHRQLIAVAGAVVFLAVAGYWAWPAITSGATSLQTSLAAALNAPEPTEVPATAPPEEEASKTARPTARSAARATAPSSTTVEFQSQLEPAAEAGAAEIPVASSSPVVLSTVADASPSAVEPTGPADAPLAPQVYSSADPDVEPPKMLSADVPRSIGGGLPVRTEAIELLVSADGSVERVRLRTAEPRMLDAMILSRAKMWQFAPAQRDGQAVPYRLVLAWQVSDR